MKTHSCSTRARAHKREIGLDAPPCSPSTPQGPRPVAEALERIATKLRCLGPDHRDPELFHVQKSDLVAELRRLARRA